jgi:alpha-beta hydrolase superfamily lysophospholipase
LVAARYAQRNDQTLTAVILSSPLIGRSDAISAMLSVEELPNVPLDASALSRDAVVGEAYAADPLVWHGSFKRTTLEAMQRAVEAVAAGPSLGELPLLWIHGADDRLVPMERSRTAIEYLRGNRVVERVYPGGRHADVRDTH